MAGVDRVFPGMGGIDWMMSNENELRSAVKNHKWGRVVEIYINDPETQKTGINRWGDTALHAAIETENTTAVKRLIRAIKSHPPEGEEALGILSLKNNRGNTPLHCAAGRGLDIICDGITKLFHKSLIGVRNKDGETPLFLSALHDRRKAFLVLHRAAGEDSPQYWRRKNGDTMLHCTIRREYFELSLIIIQRCRDISVLTNEKGESPLAVLASTPSPFISGIHLSWWERLFFHFIYAEEPNPPTDDDRNRREENTFDVEDPEMTMDEEQPTDESVTDYIRTFEAVFRFSKNIRRRLLGLKIMKLLVERDSWYDAVIDSDVRDMFSKSAQEEASEETPNFPRPAVRREHSGAEKVWTALLSGTRNGATELVRELLRRKPFAIYDETSENRNIVLVAIEARQSEILKEVMKHSSWTDMRLRHGKDVKRNNALHLSAKRSVNPSISVSVVHLQWEVHWFEYVQGLMPAYFMNEPNEEGKTPSMIFDEEHGGMLEESDKWVNDMCGNYMVATTLISSVTFATCFQIPGGYDSQKGTPIVGSTNTAFQLFAITALVSFCFSITSLAAFLAIYSSRSDRYKDYRRALPLKLLVAFFSLFVSIVSMLISFCAAHVFELYPNHKSKCFPLYLSLTSIPLCFYSATQIPLYWQLLRASFATVPSSRPFYVGQQRPEIDAEEVTERIKEEFKEPVTKRIIRMRRPTVDRVSFERPRDSP